MVKWKGILPYVCFRDFHQWVLSPIFRCVTRLFARFGYKSHHMNGSKSLYPTMPYKSNSNCGFHTDFWLPILFVIGHHDILWNVQTSFLNGFPPAPLFQNEFNFFTTIVIHTLSPQEWALASICSHSVPDGSHLIILIKKMPATLAARVTLPDA